MFIRKLEINNFRNISKCHIEPDNKINFICGCNAQGKTNLIESIYFASLFKSFRTNIKTDLIKKEENNFLIKIETVNNDVNNNLNIFFDKNKVKKISVNNKENKNPHKILNSIIYYPDEISHLKSSPSYRRNLIDRSIFFVKNDYLDIFKKYLKCLKQRNFYLKNPSHHDIWREQLIEYGSEIISERISFLERINSKLKVIEKNSQINEEYSIDYKKYDKKDIKSKLNKEFRKTEEKEKKYGYTLIGPHVDDIYFKINDVNINKYSSEGQKRSLLLSYKQAQIIDYKENNNFYPILLFDDIGNELDSTRKHNIFNKILENSGQVFITTTDFPDTRDNKTYKVNNGSFTEFI
jgi:DNA replication and repair protein RecF